MPDNDIINQTVVPEFTKEETRQLEEMEYADQGSDQSQESGQNRQDQNQSREENSQGRERQRANPQDQGDAGDEKGLNNPVPFAELKREREERQNTQKQLREMATQMATIQEQNRLFREAMQQPQQQTKIPDLPDLDKDPVGYMRALGDRVRQANEFQNSLVQRQQAEQQERDLVQRATGLENEYIKDNPDYVEAGQWLKAKRMGELQIMGMDSTAALKQVTQEARALAQNAMSRGQNPASLIHQIAKNNGFAPKQVQNDGAQRLEQIAQGQRANSSLSDVSGGGTSNGKLTASKLASMNEADFAKTTKDWDDNQWAQFMGQ